jgi:replicative DNA helicase
MGMDEFDDLTLEERNVLNDCKNPDGESAERYKWDEELQREIIGLLMNDRSFVLKTAGLIKPSYFTNEAHKLISKIIYKHFEKYNQIPNRTQLKYELTEAIENKDPKIKVFYYGELTNIAEYYVPGLDTTEYYLDKITNFAKGMAMKHAFKASLEEYNKAPEEEETWVRIEQIIREALSVDRNFDLGLDYFASFEERYERMQQKIIKGDYFITGFTEIDASLNGGGLGRGEIGSVIGLPGTGKSIFLVNAAIQNMHRGKKVLYISLEIDQDKCAERFDAQFANPEPFGDANTGIRTKNLYEKRCEVFDALRSYVSEKDDQRLLVVKQFPSGQLSLSGLRAYYAQAVQLGFRPDLLIIDYIGEMQDYPGMPIHESRPKMVRDLRGFAVQENICILTAMQPATGSAREAITLGGVIDDNNTGDAKAQNRPLDAFWSINQLNDEKECGLARLFVIKHRDGKSRFECHVQFDYDTLKMRQISKSKYNAIFGKYKNEKSVSVDEQMRKEAEVDRIMNSKKSADAMKFADVGYDNVEDAPAEEPSV